MKVNIINLLYYLIFLPNEKDDISVIEGKTFTKKSKSYGDNPHRITSLLIEKVLILLVTQIKLKEEYLKILILKIQK